MEYLARKRTIYSSTCTALLRNRAGRTRTRCRSQDTATASRCRGYTPDICTAISFCWVARVTGQTLLFIWRYGVDTRVGNGFFEERGQSKLFAFRPCPPRRTSCCRYSTRLRRNSTARRCPLRTGAASAAGEWRRGNSLWVTFKTTGSLTGYKAVIASRTRSVDWR